MKAIITPDEYKDLAVELKELIEIKRPAIIVRLQHARSLGDLSENSEYDAAREDQADLENRILEIERILQVSEVSESHEKNIVGIGSYVTVEKNGKTEIFAIGHPNPKIKNAIPLLHDAPITLALLGKKLGDSVEVVLPNKKITMIIKKIQ
ncbi:MAG: GreA/GreB family elongation factor [Alphaproteobacteria bacterium]|nr:GreA/GreB family elongation factor [Alphaproteobacteria bacterium]